MTAPSKSLHTHSLVASQLIPGVVSIKTTRLGFRHFFLLETLQNYILN